MIKIVTLISWINGNWTQRRHEIAEIHLAQQRDEKDVDPLDPPYTHTTRSGLLSLRQKCLREVERK